jgi:hypothetical protein
MSPAPKMLGLKKLSELGRSGQNPKGLRETRKEIPESGSITASAVNSTTDYIRASFICRLSSAKQAIIFNI